MKSIYILLLLTLGISGIFQFHNESKIETEVVVGQCLQYCEELCTAFNNRTSNSTICIQECDEVCTLVCNHT